jgi:hypothetical protein
VAKKLAAELSKWEYDPSQARNATGQFGAATPAHTGTSAAPVSPGGKPAETPSVSDHPSAQQSNAGQDETTPNEKKISQLLAEAQGLDKEATDIEVQISTLTTQRKQDLAEAKILSAQASSTTSTTSSTAANVTGTAAGSTSATSAATSAATQAADYEAKAAALGKQITALQQQVNQLHQQAAQLRAQAAAIKSYGANQRTLNGERTRSGQFTPTSDYIPKSSRRLVATVTDQAEATVSFPILTTKTETTPDGDLIVYGKATDGTVDTDDQIVDPKWSSKALGDWLSSGANLRVQHNPHRDPAGVGLQVDVDKDGDGSHYLKALVVEPTAKKLVSKGALRAFSVGIMRPRIVTDNKARGGRIVDGELGEVSLVDRPANRNCTFTLVKADKSGKAEWVGALTSDPDFLAKSLTPKPSDVARMLGKRSVEPAPRLPAVQQGAIPAPVFADPVATRLNEALRVEAINKRVLASGEVVDSGGQDRSGVADADFAGPGKTFPIETQSDVSDAASLAHHAKDPGAVRSRIRSIAERKWPGMKMPPSLSGDGEKAAEPDVEKIGQKTCPNCGKSYHADSEVSNCANCGTELPHSAMKADGAECSTCHGSGKIMDGNRKCPDCNGSGHMMASKADHMDDDGKDGAQDTSDNDGTGEEDNIKVRKAKMFCPGCGSKLKKSASFCPGCGSKMAMPKHVIPHSHPSPGDDVKGKKTKPVPAHREPDGDQMEDFEQDAGMQDGDEPKGKKPPEPAPTWSKGHASRDPAEGVAHTPGTTEGPDPDDEEKRPEEEFEVGHGEEDNRSPSPSGLSQVQLKNRTAEVPYGIMRMHDALCAAYDGPDVLSEYPSLKTYTDAVDAERWREAAQQVVADGNLSDGQKMLNVASAAEALNSLDPAAVEDGRALLRKNFTSMYPDVHLSPGQVTAQQFHRPYIAEGHAPLSAVSPGPQPPAKTPPESPSASQFQRGYLTDGHQSPSPGDGGNRVGSYASPSMGHMNAPKGSATSAIATIHDHIADEWPGLCAMSSNYAPVTHHKNSIDATSGSASQIADQLRRHSQQTQPAPQQLTKAEAEPLVPVIRTPKISKAVGLTEQALKSVLAAELSKATSALTETINGYKSQNEMLVKQVGDLQQQLNEIGSQPDPYAAPPRAAVAYAPDFASGGAAPQERRSLVDEAAEKMRADKLKFLKSLANSGDPVVREGAQTQIQKLLMAP